MVFPAIKRATERVIDGRRLGWTSYYGDGEKFSNEVSVEKEHKSRAVWARALKGCNTHIIADIMSMNMVLQSMYLHKTYSDHQLLRLGELMKRIAQLNSDELAELLLVAGVDEK